ncbi:MAG: SpoIID/LytB domain-containing protein [Oligoflexia bacterium]|nr:SpoIID/LytB domain-containing protein [Oligoflexia bacterium]
MRLTAILILITCFWSQIVLAEKVRVKILQLPLPLEITGEGITLLPIKSQNIRNISIPKSERIIIDSQKIGAQRVWIIRNGNNITRSSEPFLQILSHNSKVRIFGYDLPAPLLLSTLNRTNTVDVIEAVELEEYLVGVLQSEMPGHWPLEALKAQSIAARSYTLFQMSLKKGSPFHLEGNVMDQNYSTPLKSPIIDKIRKAVIATEGIVLLHNGRVTKAYYHANCGGQTEEPNLVWKGESLETGTVADVSCPFSPKSKWSLEVKFSDLKEKMQLSGHQLSGIERVQIVMRTTSSRVALIAFSDGRKNILISGQELRQAIGFDRLKSTLFSVVQKGDSVVFKGQGFGHGSGLCQWGAKTLAEKGTKAADILRHYYPRTQLTEVNVAHR